VARGLIASVSASDFDVVFWIMVDWRPAGTVIRGTHLRVSGRDVKLATKKTDRCASLIYLLC